MMRELVAAWGIWLVPGGVVTLWLLGLGGLLLLAGAPFRHLSGGALRVFSIAVAGQALLTLSAIRHAAELSAQHQNPSDSLSAAGVALVASGLVAVFCCWLGRSWTPTLLARRGGELPAAIDWSREYRLMIIAVLVLLVLLGALALTAQYWIVLFVLVLLGFGGHSGFRWSAESLQVGFLLAAVLAVAACAWLSSGQRAALRAPLRPGVALPLGCICCSLGMCFTLVSRSPVRPAWKVMHDGALVALLLDSAARDEPEPFFDARQELLRRRHSERSRRLESAALELRRVAGGPASLSARLAAQYEANPRPPQHSEDLLGGGYVASLVGNGAPELAVIDVLLARGETREALAWIADVGVPLGLRIEIAKRWSQLPALPRPIVIATLGRACVDAQKRRGPADVPLFAYQSSCDFALDRLLPREPSALTAPQGFALAYALTAVDSSLIDERLSLTTKDDVAVAMLRGIRAARLSNANRSHTIEDRTLSCDRLEQLAALVCPAVRPRICGTEAAIRSLIPLEILDPCLAQLAIETPPELVSLGGY